MNCGIVINVSDQEVTQSLGNLGKFTVPAREGKDKFAFLVVEPGLETVDEGFGKSHTKEWDGFDVARDVCGMNSDQRMEPRGILLCAARPNFPEELRDAEREAAKFNLGHPRGYDQMKNLYDPQFDKKVEMGARIQALRAKFQAECVQLVTAEEISKATKNLYAEAQRLVLAADLLWAGNPQDKAEITAQHRRAAELIGQERPWAYLAAELVDCPGCGMKIKKGVITCGHCGALISETEETYAAMTPNEKARSLYPERFAPDQEPVPVGKKK
jgi:hypothetical protein